MPEERTKLDETLDAQPYEPPKRRRSLLAFIAFALGLLGLPLFFVFLLAAQADLAFEWAILSGPVAAAIAVIFGIVAHITIARSKGRLNGQAWASVGIVLGAMALFLILLVWPKVEMVMVRAHRGKAAQGMGCSYQRVRDKELIRLLNAFTFMGEKDFGHLSVRVIAVLGESGSAHLPETDEVSTTVYVAVSEYGEYPEQRVFQLAPLYAPEMERFAVEAGKPVVRLTWGPKGGRHRLRIVVALDALDLQEEPTK